FQAQPRGGRIAHLQQGETMTLRYRVLLHRGDEKSGRVAEMFAAYAKEKK
ncbi:hypothetical protein LCGC14_2168160, partial [marine sediment metagenome]